MINQTGIKVTKNNDLFEYRKANEDYWDRLRLYKQVDNKVLSIAKALYSGYSLLLLFNNPASKNVYEDNSLYAY